MKEKIREILNHYGKDNQMGKTIEELDELKEALAYDLPREDILTETADVYVMLEQIAIIYGFSAQEVKDEMEFKVQRQLNRIEKGE